MEAKAKEQEALAAQASGQSALTHVIAAVELYMQAVQEASSASERNRLRKKCTELMLHGERLKTVNAPAEPKQGAAKEELPSLATLSIDPPAPTRPDPQSTRALSKKEQIIILKGSKLNGSVFPPWDTAPTADMFALASTGNVPFEDSTPFSMSADQRAVFTEWQRADKLFAGLDMAATDEPDLVQDITTDCSVVASLCALTRPRARPLLSGIMSPYDTTACQPLVSANGRYVFRLNFNGAFRKVVVDDRLPASSDRTLFVVDRRNARLAWPALLEKAYLKVHGGYDFPGSNSGTDLWVLAGWIPEQIFIQSRSSGSKDVDLDRVWTRVRRAFARGDVMVTLGTGRLSAEEEAVVGLAGEHDYAVLDMKDNGDGGDGGNSARRMLVKNPWCDSLVWRGGQVQDEESKTAGTGTFWIAYEDVLQYYESLYLNWNPSLFDHRQDHHVSWTLPGKALAHTLVTNPQYSMTAAADGTVWILLTRHFQDAELGLIRARKRIDKDAPDSSIGYIAIHVYEAGGKRVLLPDRPRWTHRSPLVDAAQTLVCFDAKQGVAYTVVVVQSGLPLPAYAFTLSFFSSPAPLQVAPAGDALPHQHEVPGAWTRATAGGSPASPDFVRNPQYSLTLPRATPLSLLLCADADDVPVRVDLVWAGGARVATVAVRDVAVSSGDYQRGCALAEINGHSAGFTDGVVEAGTYTVVVSTFERAQHTTFRLRVGSLVPVTLDEIAAEDAGRLRTTLAPLVLLADEGSEARYTALLEAKANTRVRLVVQAVEVRHTASGTTSTVATAAAAAAASSTAVRMSVERFYPSHSRSFGIGMSLGVGSSRGRGEVLASTGEEPNTVYEREDAGAFRDMTVAGLRTREVALSRAGTGGGRHDFNPLGAQAQGGGFFRVVVELHSGRRAPDVGLQVDVLSTDRVTVAGWEES